MSLNQLWEIYRDKLIRAVCFPLPPVRARDIIYIPSGFSSRSYDPSISSEYDDKTMKVVTSKFTSYGPTFLLYLRLGQVIDFMKNGHLGVLHSTICARVSYYQNIKDDQGTIFADQISIDRLTFIHRSCHPGSHLAIPCAPHLTALVQYAQAPTGFGDLPKEFEYCQPEAAGRFFDFMDFSENAVIDNFVSNCLIDPEINTFRAAGGLGLWTKPFLRRMRHNLLLKEDVREQIINGNANIGVPSQEDDIPFVIKGTAFAAATS